MDGVNSMNKMLIASAGVATAALALAAANSRPAPVEPPRFLEALSFPELGVTIGVRFIQGVGYRVVMRSAQEERHLSVAAARRLAGDLRSDDAGVQALLDKMGAGLRATADQLEMLLTKPTVGTA
jgi:hypothetical protein